jgi:predicted permease
MLPRASEVHLSTPVLGFTLFLSVAVGVLFGLLPALKVSSGEVQQTLRDGGRGSGGDSHRTQNSLVIFEMALALVLLAGAGLMIRSLLALARVDPGFQPPGVLTFNLAAPPSMATASPEAARAYFREVSRRMKEVPGVQAVSLSGGALPVIEEDDLGFWVEGEVKPANANGMHNAIEYTVEPDYLQIMRIPLLRGRFFATSDDEHAPRVAVIDEALARKYFGATDPLGKQLNLDGFNEKLTVIGVVGHVLQWGLDKETSNPLHAEIYFPFLQSDAMIAMSAGLATNVVIRYGGDTASTMSAIQRTMQQMNRTQAVWGAETMDHILADSLAPRRFSMLLLAIFAGLALILAAVGMYGVVSYLVGQRTREIGIRMALGADRGEIVRWILGQGGRLAVIGAGAGLVAALVLTQIMEHWSILYGVHSYDPMTMAGVTVLLMLIALVACYGPAARALRADPIRALRTE